MPPKKSKQTQLPSSPAVTRGTLPGVSGDDSSNVDGDTLRYITHVFERFDAFRREILSVIYKKQERIDKLESLNATLTKRVQVLQDRLEDVDASHRRDEFVITGNAITSESFDGDSLLYSKETHEVRVEA